MIIGSGLIDYLRAVLMEELLSAGRKRRKCLGCDGVEEYFPDAQASLALCQLAGHSAAGE
jgi:hypothetical protein